MSEIRDELEQLYASMRKKVRRGAAIGFAAPMALILQALTSWGARWPQYGFVIFVGLVGLAALHLLDWAVDHRKASRLRKDLTSISEEDLRDRIQLPRRGTLPP